MNFKYRGYIYDYEDEDEDEENCKRFHHCFCEVQGLRIWLQAVPLSPYANMTEGLWERWIQAALPTREMMGGHHPEDIDRYWQKLYGEEIDKILLGESNEQI